MAAKDAFMQYMEEHFIALTYDDVRLRTGHARVMPDDVDLSSYFSRNVPLKIPIVSAAMDTVTEHRMAIAIAKLGGIGIIHRGLSPKAQADEVARVKYHMNGLIDKPICVKADETVESILRKIDEKKFTFHSLPVIDADNKLIGLLTRDDFEFCDDTSLTASDIMSKDVITAPQGTTLADAYRIMGERRKKKLPIVDEHGRVVGLYVFSDLKRIKSGRSAMNNVDARDQLIVGAAVGVGEDAFTRTKLLAAKKVNVIVIDTAHADTDLVFETLKQLKRNFSNLDIVVGNVSQPDSVQRLIEAGADGIKVGQGPGSICTTRVIAGIGCPQVTAVWRASQVAASCEVPINADGGIRFTGDIPIAIGAGAHSVTLGSMLAGTLEAPGDIVHFRGKQWKGYRGMGSKSAMSESAASRDRYGQTGTGKDNLVPEGIEGLVPYKGELGTIMVQYLGGLRRGMGYVGAATIAELRDKANFDRLTSAGQVESHPHDVVITAEAPNYHRED